jgi:RimJ/RimL family protein N-acetyltransferase
MIITLWTKSKLRGTGIASSLKKRAEDWGREAKLDHFQTGVHANNKKMLSINEKSGFEIHQYNLRKKL